ncbi:MAG: fibronectin type III domain-containing protein, partial [Atopobiaceae bacterium]|nr:fibronectin type III domain-containing protein [Atopobiaceae bacterium]
MRMGSRFKRIFAVLMSAIMVVAMVPQPALAAEAAMDAEYDANNNPTKIHSITLEPYTYYDISTKLGGTGDLTVDNLQIIASDLFEDWGPIAARVFDTSQRVTFHNTGNWGEYFGAGVEEDDEKTDIAKYFRGGMNPDAYRHGDTSSDNTIATGLSYATSLKSILDDMCNITAEGLGDRYNTPASVIYDKVGLDSVKKNTENTKAYYRAVTSIDNNGGTFGYYYNTYALVLYDFTLSPIVAPGIKAMNPVVVTDGDDVSSESRSVSYFENKSQSESEISAEQSTESVESVTNTMSSSEHFEFSESIGSEIEFKSFFGIADVANKLQLNFTATQAIETARENSKTLEKHYGSTTSTSVTLPPHTAIAMEQEEGSSNTTFTYDCPVALRYKVAMISINGFRYDDRAGNAYWTDTNDYVAYFGTGTKEGGYSAPENLYIRAVNQGTKNKMERAYGQVTGMSNGRLEMDKIDWSQFDGQATNIQNVATRIPLLASGGSMALKRSSKNNSLGAIMPLYQLTQVKLDEGEDQYELVAGDKMSLGSLSVKGYDRDDVEYYGFDGNRGHWVLADASGNTIEASPVLGLETNDSTGRQTVTGLSEGEAYLMWVLDDDASYTAKDGVLVSSAENSPSYPKVQIVVNKAIADLTGYRVDAEGEGEVVANEQLSLPNTFPASVYDKKDRLISRAVTYEAQDTTAPITIDADGNFVATEGGDYAVRAVYARDGASIESKWLTVHVKPAPIVDAVRAESTELKVVGGKADVVLSGTHLHDDITVILTDEEGNEIPATTTGTETEQHATFDLPENRVYNHNAVYTVSYEIAGARTSVPATVTVLANTLTHVNAKEAGCVDTGNVEYWECNETGECFLDASGSVATEKNAVILTAKGHQLTKVDAADATCDDEGNIEHWKCDECGLFFADEKGETQIEQESTIIPALGHDWDAGEVTTDPTCEEAGVLTYTCKRDGSHTRTETIDPLGHDWGEWTVSKPATETEKGEETRTCKRKAACIDTREVPKLGACSHAALAEVSAVAPTCTKDGNIQYWKCNDCGRVFSDSTASEEITLDHTVDQATGHVWNEGTVTTEPTCTASGVKTITCTHAGCAAYKTEPVEALGHEWGEGSVTKEPTCLERGVRTFTCAHDVSHTKNEPVDALGHAWDKGTITKRPTCTATGIKTYTCTHDATHTKTETVKALGHSWGNWTNLNGAQHQRVCTHDATHTQRANHTWDSGVVTKAATIKSEGVLTYTCTGCGATKSKTIPKVVIKGTLLNTVKAKGKSALTISWNEIEGAEGYDVFLAPCNGEGKKYTLEVVEFHNANTSRTATIKDLKQNTCYKARVKAFVQVGGKKVYVRSGKAAHCFTAGGSKTKTNPKGIKVKKTKISLKKGKSTQIKASVVKSDASKDVLSESHVATLRYQSSNPKIATVSKSGMILAKRKGSCKVYVIAANGAKKAIKVT